VVENYTIFNLHFLFFSPSFDLSPLVIRLTSWSLFLLDETARGIFQRASLLLEMCFPSPQLVCPGLGLSKATSGLLSQLGSSLFETKLPPAAIFGSGVMVCGFLNQAAFGRHFLVRSRGLWFFQSSGLRPPLFGGEGSSVSSVVQKLFLSCLTLFLMPL
jgi:hypothetical protein